MFDRERKQKFVKSAKADAIKWIEDHVTDDTEAIAIITDNSYEWWVYSGHVFNQAPLSNLWSRLKIASSMMKDKLTDWANTCKEHIEKQDSK